MTYLLDHIDDLLAEAAIRHKLPAYRVKQVREWLFSKRADSWDAMSNLPKKLRTDLAEELTLWQSTIVKHTGSSDGTEKLLVGLKGGGSIECVLLRENVRGNVV